VNQEHILNKRNVMFISGTGADPIRKLHICVSHLNDGWPFCVTRFKLTLEQVWCSVFEDDDEAFAIWRDEVLPIL
jgi:hypothetical protein